MCATERSAVQQECVGVTQLPRIGAFLAGRARENGLCLQPGTLPERRNIGKRLSPDGHYVAWTRHASG